MPLDDLKALTGRKRYNVGDTFCAFFFFPKHKFCTWKSYANDGLFFLEDILIND